MTKHNLRENLNWLIITPPTFPHNYPTATSAPASPPLTLEPVQDKRPANEEQRAHVKTKEERTPTEYAESEAICSEFLRPTLPASALNGRGRDAMARLQAGPKSNKPRLLSESIPVSLRSPSAVTERPSPSLKENYIAHYNRASEGSILSKRSPNRLHRTIRPHTNEPVNAEANHDFEHVSSSSTIEAFGESRALWREDSALREEPLRPRTGKRKSDELDVDELQRVDPVRISQGSFTAIDEFSDGGTPSKPRKSHDAHVQRSAKRVNVGETMGKLSNLNDGESKCSPRLSGIPLTNISTQVWKPQALTSPIATKQSPTKGPRSIQKHPLSSTHQGSIADSEGSEGSEGSEDELSLNIDHRATTFKTEPSPLSGRIMVISPKKEQNSIKSEDDDTRNDTSPPKAPKAISPTKLGRSSSDASPYQRDSPTKLPIESSQPLPSVSPGKSTSKAIAVDESLVRSFLNYKHSRVQAYLDNLYGERRSAAEAIYNSNMAGQVIPLELKTLPAKLSEKINALNTLLPLRKEHQKLTKKKEALKSGILDMISRDLPMEMYETDLAIQHQILDRLKEVAQEVCSLIAVAELPLDDESSISEELSILKPTALHEIQTSKTLVQSTPSTQRRLTPAVPESRYSNTAGIPPRPFVQQTQAGHSETPFSPSNYRRDLPPIIHPDQPQGYADDPSKDVNAYFSPRKKNMQQRSPRHRSEKNSPQATTEHLTKQSTARLPSIYDDENNEDLFARNMGSPLRATAEGDECLYDDNFGQDDDDVDMLEAFDQIQIPQKQTPAHMMSGNRDVLAETSGNVMRFETAKGSAAFTPAPPAPSQMQHQWSKEVKAAMRDRFHLRGFRPNQLEAINATLSGKDAFVLMPTGGGKSLCYQLPSIITSGRTHGVTVVISPLLSLMHDQVEHLQKLKIQALFINGEVSAEHRKLVMSCLKESQPQRFCQLLYITPEMINQSQAMLNSLRDLHRRDQLARIVIDEAHCVSQWGHDFRPDYKQLGEVRRQFKGVPLIALTATATENVKVDVMHNLGMINREIFTQSFNRPNLSYEVRIKGKAKNVLDDIAQIINESYRDQTGIIYCLSKKNCEDLAGKLRDQHSIRAQHYHAGMEPEEKKLVQKEWQMGKHHVIVATIAFGMGIDKPDVRYVIHHTIPKSLEGYYQETGRAGRDGRKSGCVLYYGYGDSSALKRMIDDGEGSYEQKERQRAMLRNVVQFCENRSDCRRVQILGYFNETFQREDCAASCDNCASNSSFVTEDLSEYASAAIKLVENVQNDNVTILHCIDVFRGARNRKISDTGHDQLPQFGQGSHLDRGHVERLWYRLVSEDAIFEFNKMNKSGFANQYVRLGRNAREFRSMRRKLKLQVRLSPNGKAKPKSKPGQREIGVAASRADHPASTNVSSPIQAVSRRRATKPDRVSPAAEHQRRRDVKDDWIVSDEEDLTYETEDTDPDAFQPIREVRNSRAQKKKQLGPPITTDEKLAGLNEIHQYVVEEFVHIAKEKNDELYKRKDLRDRPFTDSALRAMAIDFPKNEAEMMSIPGINPEKVQHFGKYFLELIRRAHNDYEEMMQRREDHDVDPNHRNVIDISSDSDSEHDETTALDDLESLEGERSAYFPGDDVAAFNERFSQMAPPSIPKAGKATSQKPPDFTSGGSKRGRPSSGRGGFKSNKNSSGSRTKGKGVAKRKATSHRSSGSSFVTTPSIKERFPMMPT